MKILICSVLFVLYVVFMVFIMSLMKAATARDEVFETFISSDKEDVHE